MLYVRVLRQYELIGNVDNARVSSHGVDLVSLTDPTLLLFGSTALSSALMKGTFFYFGNAKHIVPIID
jgi:hypothetical protein